MAATHKKLTGILPVESQLPHDCLQTALMNASSFLEDTPNISYEKLLELLPLTEFKGTVVRTMSELMEAHYKPWRLESVLTKKCQVPGGGSTLQQLMKLTDGVHIGVFRIQARSPKSDWIKGSYHALVCHYFDFRSEIATTHVHFSVLLGLRWSLSSRGRQRPRQLPPH